MPRFGVKAATWPSLVGRSGGYGPAPEGSWPSIRCSGVSLPGSAITRAAGTPGAMSERCETSYPAALRRRAASASGSRTSKPTVVRAALSPRVSTTLWWSAVVVRYAASGEESTRWKSRTRV